MATRVDIDGFLDAVMEDPERYRPALRAVRELFEALEKNRPAKVKALRARYRSWAELDRAYAGVRAARARDAQARRVLEAIGDVALAVARTAAAL